MSRIRLLIQSKLDADTLHYLQEPEKYTDSETYNLRVEDSLAKHQLTFCLWGNVVKDPRYQWTIQYYTQVKYRHLYTLSAIHVYRVPPTIIWVVVTL